ncbi:hypothetical protein NADFUDRAFT_51269 [Nadsonia fulvescens var. elongata DSM 6958]|uniref:NUDE domain-containing protein n=1 Tax=Nadsonia fulvescens var. elongata DSM 6958 TaxID=857566 RepID=A0A1E3PKP4_9ASCO|nr:hypothetical protein NADFUDRAFT_51269 [Nadsonia fulvescens var. elongata DSM 6958]
MTSVATPDEDSSGPRSGLESESGPGSDNYELKLKLLQLEQELCEFQESSRELELELEQELEESERQQKRLDDKIAGLLFENKEIKKKMQEQTQEMAKTQLTFQKEIVSLREAYKLVKDRLTEIEMENDNMEQHGRITKSSLEDLELKYNSSLEAIAMLEAELASKEIIGVDLQRTKEELRDVNEEMNFNKLKLAEKTTEVEDLYLQLNALKKIPSRAYRSFSYQGHEQANPINLLSTASGISDAQTKLSPPLLLPMEVPSIHSDDESLISSASVSRHLSNSRSMRRIQGIMEQTKTLEKTLSSFKFYLPKPLTPSKYKPGRSRQVRPRIVTDPIPNMGEMIDTSRLISPATIAMTSTQVAGDLFTPEQSPSVANWTGLDESSVSVRIHGKTESVVSDHPGYFSFVPKSGDHNISFDENKPAGLSTPTYNSTKAASQLRRNQSMSGVSLRQMPSMAREKLIELHQSPQIRKRVDSVSVTPVSNYKDNESSLERTDYRPRWNRSFLNFGGLVGNKPEKTSDDNSRQDHLYASIDDSDWEDSDGFNAATNINVKRNVRKHTRGRSLAQSSISEVTAMNTTNSPVTTTGRSFFGRYFFSTSSKEDGENPVLTSGPAKPLPLPVPTFPLPQSSSSISEPPRSDPGSFQLALSVSMAPPLKHVQVRPGQSRSGQSQPQQSQSQKFQSQESQSQESQSQESQSFPQKSKTRKSKSMSPFKRKGKVYSHNDPVYGDDILPPSLPLFPLAMDIPKSPFYEKDNNENIGSLNEATNAATELVKVWSSLPNPPLSQSGSELNGTSVGSDSVLKKKSKRLGLRSNSRAQLVGDNEFARQFDRGASVAIGHGKLV